LWTIHWRGEAYLPLCRFETGALQSPKYGGKRSYGTARRRPIDNG
jgi:hypothetical protein